MFSIARDPGSKTVLYYQNKKRRKSTLDFVPSIEVSRKASKIITSKQQIDKTFQKMAIEKESIKLHINRLANRDMFLNFDYNPFSHEKKQKQLFLQISEKPTRNIVNLEMGKKRTKSTVEIRSLKERQNLQFQQKEAERKSAKLICNITKIQLDNHNERFTGYTIKKNEPIKMQTKNLFPEELDILDMQIDEIARIKQSNYFFSRNRPKVNIFLLAKNQSTKISAFDHLEHKRFNFKAVVQKNYKNKTNIYRDLSRFGRATLCGYQGQADKMIDFLNSNQLLLDKDERCFQDLLNIATNRLSPESIVEINQNFEQRKSDIQQQPQITHTLSPNKLLKGIKCNGSNFAYQNYDRYIIDGYMLADLQEKEMKQVSKLQKKIRLVSQLQEKRKKIYENQIRDEKLHRQILDQVKQNVKNFLKSSKQRIQDISKTVRDKKLMYDKTTILKIKSINCILKEKYRMQNAYQMLKRENKK